MGQKYKGLYAGIVQSNQDPRKLGQVKVSVAGVYGINGDLGVIGVNDLPWAIPAGVPAGGSKASGGIDWIPEPGDQVLVAFLDGEPEKPVWMWLMQTTSQAQNFPLHLYQNGVPARGALTRYGHTVELNETSLLLSTASGYQIGLLNGDPGLADGMIQIATAGGQYEYYDDSVDGVTLNVGTDYTIMAGGTWTGLVNKIEFTTAADDIDLTAGGNFNLSTALGTSLRAAGDMSFATTGLTAPGDISQTATGDFHLTTLGVPGLPPHPGDATFTIKHSLTALTQTMGMSFTAQTNLDLTTVSGSIESVAAQRVGLTAGADIILSAGGDISLSAGGNLDLSGAGLNISMGGEVDLVTEGLIRLGFSNLFLGENAAQPFVLGNLLVALLTDFLNFCNTHVHDLGTGTTGTTVQPFTPPAITGILSKEIFGQ